MIIRIHQIIICSKIEAQVVTEYILISLYQEYVCVALRFIIIQINIQTMIDIDFINSLERQHKISEKFEKVIQIAQIFFVLTDFFDNYQLIQFLQTNKSIQNYQKNLHIEVRLLKFKISLMQKQIKCNHKINRYHYFLQTAYTYKFMQPTLFKVPFINWKQNKKIKEQANDTIDYFDMESQIKNEINYKYLEREDLQIQNNDSGVLWKLLVSTVVPICMNRNSQQFKQLLSQKTRQKAIKKVKQFINPIVNILFTPASIN